MRQLALVALVAVTSCVRGTNHEHLGDRRYAERSWPDALAEYRLAARQHHGTPLLYAKLAMTAMHAMALEDAADAWRQVARGDPAGRDLAAEGLVRTARSALQERDVAGLHAAVAGLRELAPERLAELGGGLPEALDDSPTTRDADLTLAAAAASRGIAADSLVSAWADANARAGRCDLSMRAWDGLRRRHLASAIVRAAQRGLAGCQLEAGRAALAAGQLEQAETSFRAAIAIGSPDSVVRLAWLLVGDALWAAGDTATAAESYRKAIAGGDEESQTVIRARAQLQKLTGQPITP